MSLVEASDCIQFNHPTLAMEIKVPLCCFVLSVGFTLTFGYTSADENV